MAAAALSITAPKAPYASSRDIDLVHLARQTAGDRGLEREVLGLFREQCVRQLAAMAAAGRSKAGRDAAHTLVGAARGVGAFRVADLAEQVEIADEEGFSTAIGELDRAVADARALIERLLAIDPR